MISASCKNHKNIFIRKRLINRSLETLFLVENHGSCNLVLRSSVCSDGMVHDIVHSFRSVRISYVKLELFTYRFQTTAEAVCMEPLSIYCAYHFLACLIVSLPTVGFIATYHYLIITMLN